MVDGGVAGIAAVAGGIVYLATQESNATAPPITSERARGLGKHRTRCLVTR